MISETGRESLPASREEDLAATVLRSQGKDALQETEKAETDLHAARTVLREDREDRIPEAKAEDSPARTAEAASAPQEEETTAIPYLRLN